MEETEKLFQYLDEAAEFLYYHLKDEDYKVGPKYKSIFHNMISLCNQLKVLKY